MKSEGLRSEVVGLVGAATLGVVMLSPAITLIANFGPSFICAGRRAPLAFLLGLLATLPTAISYAVLASEHPDSGSAARWSALAGGERLGRWAGWVTAAYYFNSFVLQPVTAGVFLRDLASTAGLSSPALYAVGAAAACAGPAWLAYRGIARSTRGALLFLSIESLVVLALCGTVLWALPGHSVGAAGLRLPATPQAAGGLASAMVFSMLSFCGFDVISTLSEETRTPRRLIPRATFLALAVFGGAMIAGVWVLSCADTPERLLAAARSGGMPINEIAVRYWGRAAALIPLTALSAAFGISIATAVGTSRILYSMGRSGLAPAALAELHPVHRVPWNAMHLVFGLGLAAALATGLGLGPYGAYVWWGTTSTFFALLTYFLVNGANIVLLGRRARESAKGFLLHLAVPAAGLALDGAILWRSFLVQPWREGGWSRAALLFNLACAGAALAAAAAGGGSAEDDAFDAPVVPEEG